MGTIGTTIIIILVLIIMMLIAALSKRGNGDEKMNMELYARKHLGEEFAESEKYVSHEPRLGFYIDKQRDKIALIRVRDGKYDPKVIDEFHCDKVVEHMELVNDKYFFAVDRVRRKALLWAMISSTAKEGKTAKLKVVHYSDIKGVELFIDDTVLYRTPGNGSEETSDADVLKQKIDELRERTDSFSNIKVRVRLSDSDALSFKFECMTSQIPVKEKSLVERHLLKAYELVKILTNITLINKA